MSMVASNPVQVNVITPQGETLAAWLGGIGLAGGNIPLAIAWLSSQGVASASAAISFFDNLGMTVYSDIVGYIDSFIGTKPVINPQISVTVTSWPDIEIKGTGYTPSGAAIIYQQAASAQTPPISIGTVSADSAGDLNIPSISIILSGSAQPYFMVYAYDVISKTNSPPVKVINPSYGAATPQFVTFTAAAVNFPYTSPQPLGSKANPLPAYNGYSSQYQYYWWVSKSKENASPITSQSMFNAYNMALGFS